LKRKREWNENLDIKAFFIELEYDSDACRCLFCAFASFAPDIFVSKKGHLALIAALILLFNFILFIW
jgi:hypothetical protein